MAIYQDIKQKVHYGWVVVFGCILLSSAGTTILINCIGVFIKPVSSILGFNRGEFAIFYTFSQLATMLSSPFMGNILKTKDQRIVISLCSVGAALLLCVYTVCTKLWQFYIVGFFCGIFTSGLTSMSISTLINRWFVEKKGLAMGIAFAGSGLGAMILIPITSHIIEKVNWMTAFYFLALILVAINVPVAVFLIKNRPSDIGLLPYGAKEAVELKLAGGNERQELSITRSQAVRLPEFWIFAAVICLVGITGVGVQQHVHAFLTDIGYTASFAAKIVSMTMGWLIIGKLLLGLIYDRYGGVAGTAFICALSAFSTILLMFADVPIVPYLFAVTFGMAYAILAVPATFLTSYLLGPEDYSSNYGIVNMFLCLGMSFGSPISAFIYDNTKSYYSAWVMYTFIALITLALLLLTIARFKNIKQNKQSWEE